jgi:hypothetical protein
VTPIRNVLEALRKRWMRFWFEPVASLNLGLCRVLCFGALFLLYLDYDVTRWTEASDSRYMPVWIFQVLHLPVLSSGLVVVLQIVWKISLALSCIGLFTRISTVSSFILGMYLLGLPNNFGKVGHGAALVVFVFGVMALSRCGDSCSIDRLIWKARQRNDASHQRTQVSGEYTWPVRAVWVMFALIFFGAGVSKLRHSGLEWIFSDNMAVLLLRAQFQGKSAVPWGFFLAQHQWLTQLVAAATIAIEVGYPLALFSRKARWILVPGAFSMQIGISLLMGITFSTFLICNLFWVRWDYVSSRFASSFRMLMVPRKRSSPTTTKEN